MFTHYNIILLNILLFLYYINYYTDIFERIKPSDNLQHSKESLRSINNINTQQLIYYHPNDIIQHYQLKDQLEVLGNIHLYKKEDYVLEYSDTDSIDKLFLSYNQLYSLEYLNDINHQNENQYYVQKSYKYQRTNNESLNDRYYLQNKLFLGGHGEIWRAKVINNNSNSKNIKDEQTDQYFILKRMYVKNQPSILRCALREIYYGTKLKNNGYVSRFITYFIHNDDYWLVFQDEGVSLQQLLYAITLSIDKTSSDSASYDNDYANFNTRDNKGSSSSSKFQFSILEPSAIWLKLRSTDEGKQSIKSLLFQIITGVNNLHKQGIVHRDLKPSNILLHTLDHQSQPSEDQSQSSEDDPPRHTSDQLDDDDLYTRSSEVAKLIIADFSSAINDEALNDLKLFSEDGPTLAELTMQYASPELIFNITTTTSSSSSFNINNNNMYTEAYDIWSIGIIFLEVILGTANVFSVDQRTSAMIAHRLQGFPPKMVEQALILAAMADYCIYDGHAIHSSSYDDATENKYSRIGSSGVISQNNHDFFSKLSLLSGYKSSFTHTPPTASSSQKSTVTTASTTASNSEKKDKQTFGEKKICGNYELAKAIQRRDPLGIGFLSIDGPNRENFAIDLIARLLQWDPRERIPLEEALQHAYFVGAYTSKNDGTKHPTLSDLYKYEAMYQREFQQTREYPRSHTTANNKNLPISTIQSKEETKSHSLALLTSPISNLISRSTTNYGKSSHYQASSIQTNSSIRVTSRHHYRNETWRCISCSNIVKTPISLHRISSKNITSTTDNDSDNVVIDNNMDVPHVIKNIFDEDIIFQCPKCKRSFAMDWHSCDKHVKIRKHGNRCIYNISHSSSESSLGVVPYTDTDTLHSALTCISHHSMLPIDEQSGWCDLQGRRKHIEDAHAVVFSDRYKFFGIFDGHWGSRAAKFSSRHIHALFDLGLQSYSSSSDDSIHSTSINIRSSNSILCNQFIYPLLDRSFLLKTSKFWQDTYSCDLINQSNDIVIKYEEKNKKNLTIENVMKALQSAFMGTNADFINVHSESENSGTTATTAVLFETHVFIANIGDSRATLCCDINGEAIELTIDHTPYLHSEYQRIIDSGGWIEDYGVLRVNGQLAVTRSIGDRKFRQVLSSNPDVIAFKRDTITTFETNSVNDISNTSFCMIASDGLWDVMTNQDAIDFVCDHLYATLEEQINISKISTIATHFPTSSTASPTSSNNARNILPIDTFHKIARNLAQEAYIRGSMDNIGVCIINLYN